MLFIKKIIKNTLYVIYILVNMLFFYKKKRILFISYPDATDNSWHLYKYCLERLSGYEFVWLVDSQSDTILNKITSEFKNKNKNKNKLLIFKRWSIKGFLAFCCSKYVFHTHGTYFFIKPALFAPTIVNLWHGMPIKAIGHLDKKQDKYFCYSDYVICTSKFYQKIMAKVFDIETNKVLITGLPRNDIFHRDLDRVCKENILKKFEIENNERYIIWLPTYRVSNTGERREDSESESFLSEFEPDFLEDLNELCVSNCLNIIIKMHPMDALCTQNFNKKYNRIKFYDSSCWNNLQLDLYEVIANSNGLLSDYSSVIVDCLNTNIPIGVISDRLNSYNRKLIISPILIHDFTKEIKNIKDFIELVDFKNKHIENVLNSQKISSEILINKIGLV